MFRQAHCPEAEALVAFLYDEFDGTEVFDRRAIARHLEGCDRCTAEVASLGGVRQTLREWAAPEMSLGFRVVTDPPRRFAWLPAWSMPALPLAAAAMLVLGAALGLARFDVQYDANGLRVRTGWGHGEAAATGVANAGFAPAPAVRAPVSEPAGARPLPTAASATGTAPWRAEMQALERQMRQELATLRHSGGAATERVAAANVLAGDPSTAAGDQTLIRRIQQLIDQSEVRQQQNLALRSAELSREFDLQRRSDLVRIEQGFGKIADQRAQDAEQQRQFFNAIRVSQQRQP